MTLSQPVRCLLATVVAPAVWLAAAPLAAYADWAPASIAVPLLGTRGPGSVYPSRLTVAARGGADHVSEVTITLHAVTHPCIEDLAVLLVHNGTDKFLLLANAGSCRPLQGTDVRFQTSATNPIPDSQSASTAYSSLTVVKPSVYGGPPVFPAPAPAGPYNAVLPSTSTNVNGTWDLYVYDTTDTHRGVIAGGWSLHYDTAVRVDADQTAVNLPGGPVSRHPRPCIR